MMNHSARFFQRPCRALHDVVFAGLTRKTAKTAFFLKYRGAMSIMGGYRHVGQPSTSIHLHQCGCSPTVSERQKSCNSNAASRWMPELRSGAGRAHTGASGGLVVRCSGASRPGWCALLPAGGHRSLVGLCAAGGGPPWKASHGRGGVGGGQARGPLPWPASGRCWSSCLEATQCNRRSLSRQGQGALRPPHGCALGPRLDTRSL